MFFKFLFFLISCIPLGVWANDEVQVSVDVEQVNIWENITLDILFDPGASQWEIELSIPGIEDFSVFSQSQRQQSRVINGEAEAQFRYTLQIRPLQEGVFTIGPVQINLWIENLTDDEILEIQVWTIQDLWDIKPELRPLRNFEFSKEFLIVLWILFFGVFFYILRKYFYPETEYVSKEIPQHILEEKRKIELYFQKLEHDYEHLSGQEFSKKLIFWIRKILAFEALDASESATLYELQQNKAFWEHALSDIFSMYYESEFTQRDVIRESRKESLEYIKKHIRNIWK